MLTSKTLRARESAGILELRSVKKRLSNALPSSSSKTICSLASDDSAATAAASLSFLASSIKLCLLPKNLGDYKITRQKAINKTVIKIPLKLKAL